MIGNTENSWSSLSNVDAIITDLAALVPQPLVPANSVGATR